MKKHFSTSRIINYLCVVALPFMLDHGKDFIEIRNELKQTNIENTQQKDRIIKSNRVSEIRYNKLNQLIENTEECITTQKILIADAGLNDEIIKTYELLSDSLASEIIRDEIKDKIKTANVDYLTSIEFKSNLHQNIHLKKEVLKTNVKPKKRLISRLLKK